MLDTKSQNSNMLLAFLTLTGVIAIVALVGFFMLRKGPEIVQGQAEVTEYRVSSKVPGRILEFRVKEGQSVQAGDTLAILEAPDVQAKLEQARAAESAAQAQNEKALKGARREQIQAAYEMWQKALAGLEIAEKSYTRVKNLHDQGVMSTQKLDEVTAQRNAARATEKAAKAQYDICLLYTSEPSMIWPRTVRNARTKPLPLPWWNVPKELWPKLNRTSRKLT